MAKKDKKGKKKDKNYFFPVPGTLTNNPQNASQTFNVATNVDTSPNAVKKNLTNYIAPVQLQRIRHDVAGWRACTDESERAYYPHRVRMQRMFLDTELNGHVLACVEARKDLTLLREYEFFVPGQNPDGSDDVVYPEYAKMFEDYAWFDDFVNFVLDSVYFGYSLIALGNIVDGMFEKVTCVRRWNVSPDRYQVSSYIYSNSGIDWRNAPYDLWHIYVPTTNKNGISPCGYGLYYNIAIYEIFLRNLLGYNADFVELYAMPYRIGKTTKTTESERAELEAAVRNMGSAGYAIVDPMDDISFIETNLGGTGWKGYENLEMRCQKLISKMILGHADAMDSIAGKLGNDSADSPAQVAMSNKGTRDGKLVRRVINEQLIPRMMLLGFEFPEGVRFRYKNDSEVKEIRDQENKANQAVATIAKDMSTAGLKMDRTYFEERTGIKTELVVAPTPTGAPAEKPAPGEGLSDKTKARLQRIYGLIK